MGKQRYNNDVNPELAKYLSSSDSEDDDIEQTSSTVPVEEIQRQECQKVVLIGNVPVASQEKIEKLREKLQAIIVSKIGEECQPPMVYIPLDAENASIGVSFAYLDSQENAQVCVNALDGYKFGKNVLRCYLYSQIGEEIPTFQPTEKKTQEEPLDLNGWLLDGREQFILRFADQTQVKWCDSLAFNAESEHVYGGERDIAAGKAWCRKNVMWSPKGSFLATFHDQGLVLWGGADFQKAGRFAHPRMTHAEVSPCERYVVTFEELHDSTSQRENLLVWNIKTQTVKRSFHVPGYVQDIQWPVMKWSSDGQYIARQIENGIAVYETSSMALLDGKPVACKGLVSFEWSPAENKIAFWSPEEGNVPARICIIDPVKRGAELRSKIVFSVQSVKLFWQTHGDFLCAQVTRTKKKTVFTSFELFRLRDNGVPNETMNVNETVGAFSFEPSGVRFAIVHTAQPDQEVQQKMHVSFYTLGSVKNGKEISLLHKLENRPCNTVVFAPHQQGVVCIASLEQFSIGSGNGSLEFFDLDTKQVLNQVEHYNCSQFQWDPSGRFALSVCCQPFGSNVPVRYTVDNGYRVWSFQGQRLQDVSIHDLYQVVWRPRPTKSVLTEEEIEDVRKKLPNTMRRMDKEDALNKKRRAAAANAARIIELEAFRSVLQERSKTAAKKRTKSGLPPVAASTAAAQGELEEIVEKVEELLSEKTELYVPGDE